jgi:aminocarboxymuconate-semialdehyde decarboxylase
MDQFPGYSQILSLASPTIESLADSQGSPELARIGNDAMAAAVSKYKHRFPGFIASLPMNNPEAALAEMSRAAGKLGAIGVQIYTNVNGQPVDKGEYLQIFEAAGELRLPVWLHPVRSMMTADYAEERYSKYDLWWMIPMMRGRIESGLSLMGTRNPSELSEATDTNLKELPLKAFQKFYADTASFGSREAIECGLAFFGVDRLLFGTDMPFDPEGGAGYIRDTLSAIDGMALGFKEREAILSGNAYRLLGLR